MGEDFQTHNASKSYLYKPFSGTDQRINSTKKETERGRHRIRERRDPKHEQGKGGPGRQSDQARGPAKASRTDDSKENGMEPTCPSVRKGNGHSWQGESGVEYVKHRKPDGKKRQRSSPGKTESRADKQTECSLLPGSALQGVCPITAPPLPRMEAGRRAHGCGDRHPSLPAGVNRKPLS